MVQGRDDIVGLDSAVILAPQVWKASGHLETFVDPLTECTSCHKRFREDHLDRGVRGQARPAPEGGLAGINCPNCGIKGQFTEPRNFNGLLSTYLGPVQDEVVAALPAARDRAGHLRQLRQRRRHRAQEAAVRHRAGRQVVPQRDHARQLHLPHPRVRADGDGVLRQARHRRGVARVLAQGALGLVRRPRAHARQPALLRAPEGEALPLLQAHGRHRVQVQLRRLGVRRARGHRQPHRLRPQDALRGARASTCRTSTRRPTSAGSRTSSSRRPASPARCSRSCSRRTTRTRRPTPRAASTSAP